MANRVFLHKDGYIEISVIGDQNEASVRAMGEQITELLERQTRAKKPRIVLDDITKLGHTDIGARRTVAELAKLIHFDRLAMLGDGSVMMRVGTNLLLSAIGKGSKIHYFDDRAAAMAWLTEGH
jgi:UDP-N-acetylmuramyl pentapeptide synthase